MLKLFAVLLGGRADGCNVELHDVVFVVGNSLEDTHSQLMNKWFGNKKRLHIDCSIELQYLDGHEIVITKTKPTHNKKLFFVNFGAYKPNYFGEHHEVNFYIGNNKSEVLGRAKQDLCLTLIEPHCDDNIVVDDIILLDQIDEYYLDIHPSPCAQTLNIKSLYQPLN